MNIEVNHATLSAGHSFHHEIATATGSASIFGSIDANRGDPQNGWDTDQFPNSVEEMALALYAILQAGGLTTGGFNFDAKLRRQSMDPSDLFHGHIGGMDTLAKALLAAAELVEDGRLAEAVQQRYAGWESGVGREILDGKQSLADLWQRTLDGTSDPAPVSGRQERLENWVNQCLDRAAARAAR